MNCPVCKKSRGNKEQIVSHIEKAHSNQIPDNMNTYQYLYLLNYGRASGSCVVDGAPTAWNDVTQKPSRLCGNPECEASLRKDAKANMDRVYGEGNHPVNDPEHQMKMQRNKKKNLIYKFKDGTEIVCLSKDEYKLVGYVDRFLEIPSNRVMECPYVFEYDDSGIKRNYIPDLYLVDYNLIIEQKDAGNTNPDFIKETRYKVKLKAAAVEKDGRFNYIIVYGSNYSPLLKMLYDIRMMNTTSNKTEKLIVHNETVATPYQVVDFPPLFIGVVKQHGVFLNLFLTDSLKCDNVYIGDEDYNLSRISISHSYFKDKECSLYRYTGEMGDSQKEYFRTWLLGVFQGQPVIELVNTPPVEWILDSMANNGINFYLDNIINNNMIGNTDFTLVLSKSI